MSSIIARLSVAIIFVAFGASALAATPTHAATTTNPVFEPASQEKIDCLDVRNQALVEAAQITNPCHPGYLAHIRSISF